MRRPHATLRPRLLLMLLSLGPARAADPPVLPEAILDQVRPASPGEVHLIAWAEGVLQGDVPVLAVLFSFAPGSERDPLHAQFLVVLPRTGYEQVADQLPSKVQRVGGARQHFSSLAISERLINLKGKSYAPGDPRCCPSRSVTFSYQLDGPWLTAVVTERQDCQRSGALQRDSGGA